MVGEITLLESRFPLGEFINRLLKNINKAVLSLDALGDEIVAQFYVARPFKESFD